MPWLQSIIKKGQMSDSAFFQLTDLLDWRNRGNNQAVLEPLISFLAEAGDEVIFAFDDKMVELLYALDTPDIIDRMNVGYSSLPGADRYVVYFITESLPFHPGAGRFGCSRQQGIPRKLYA